MGIKTHRGKYRKRERSIIPLKNIILTLQFTDLPLQLLILLLHPLCQRLQFRNLSLQFLDMSLLALSERSLRSSILRFPLRGVSTARDVHEVLACEVGEVEVCGRGEKQGMWFLGGVVASCGGGVGGGVGGIGVDASTGLGCFCCARDVV